MNRPGLGELSENGADQDNIVFSFGTVHDWGESGQGVWTLTIRDLAGGDTGVLNSWNLRLYGDAASADDTYAYTNEFAAIGADAARRTLADAGGADTINGAALTGSAVIDLSAGSATIAGRAVTFAAGTVIENAIGGDGADQFTGGSGVNHLSSGRGNDILRGGAGADVLDGGAGIDLASYYGSWVRVVVNLTTATASGGDAQGDSLARIENLSGSQVGDALFGSAGANTLSGWWGDDLIVGVGGQDTLAGGVGADRFAYGSTWESQVGAGSDRITDFSHAQGDKVDLSVMDADAGLAGNQAFTFIGTGLYSHHAGELRFAVTDPTTTTIAGDITGDGVSDFHIRLTGAIALVVADFVL